MVIVHTGDIAGDEYLESYRNCARNEGLDPGFNIVIDLRDAEKAWSGAIPLKNAFDEIMGKKPGDTIGHKIAVVANSDLFRLTREYSALSGLNECTVSLFGRMPAALEWLGLPGDFLDDFMSV